jgi:hypothetical protein
MPEIDDLLARWREDAARAEGDAEGVVERAMTALEGAPSPRAMAQNLRRQVAGACLGAAVLIGGGGGLAMGAAPVEDSPLSPDYALSPAALFDGG